MSFLDDLKKILFVGESVTKSAADKAGDLASEKGGEMLDKTGEMLNTAKESAFETGGKIYEKSGDYVDKAKDTAEDLGSKLMETGNNLFEKAKDVTSDILESEQMEKAKHFTEDLGGKVLETGGELVDKGKVVAENVGGKVMAAGAVIMDKAQDMADKAGTKMEGVMEQAEAEATKQKMEDSIREAKGLNKDIADKVGYDNLDGSLMDGKDDFFAKAEKWAGGDFGSFGPSDDETTSENTTPEIPKDKPTLELPDDDGEI